MASISVGEGVVKTGQTRLAGSPPRLDCLGSSLCYFTSPSFLSSVGSDEAVLGLDLLLKPRIMCITRLG